MTKKNIGIVIPNLGIGGNQKSAANISKVISSHYNIIFLLFDTKEIHNSYMGKIIDLKSPPKSSNIKRILHSFTRIIKLKRIIRRERLDTIYLFLNPENVLNYITYKNCKKIISCRDFASLKANSKKFKKQLEKSDLMICNSNYLKQYYLSLYPEDKQKVKAIHNIIDINLIKNSQEESVEKEFEDFIASHRVIISVGRFCREKGFANLIKSFEILKETTPDVRLVLIGDGELYKDISTLVTNSKVSKDIMLLGYKSNPFKYMKRCDIFALSSINEGFPNVILEAMACGLPIVSTNCKSGPSEILNNEYVKSTNFEEIISADYGILTTPFEYNPEYNQKIYPIFAKALEKMINDRELREEYKKLSLIRVETYSQETVFNKYLDVIKSLEQ